MTRSNVATAKTSRKTTSKRTTTPKAAPAAAPAPTPAPVPNDNDVDDLHRRAVTAEAARLKRLENPAPTYVVPLSSALNDPLDGAGGRRVSVTLDDLAALLGDDWSLCGAKSASEAAIMLGCSTLAAAGRDCFTVSLAISELGGDPELASVLLSVRARIDRAARLLAHIGLRGDEVKP